MTTKQKTGKSLVQLCKEYNINYITVRHRVYILKWELFTALSTPVRKKESWDNKTHICTSCNKELPVEEFYPSNKGRSSCKFCYSKRTYERAIRIKTTVVNHYTNGAMKCPLCIESRLECLTIDHINDDGKQERETNKQTGTNFYNNIIKNNFPSHYQVLCQNCNWYKECLRKRKNSYYLPPKYL